MNTEWSFKVHRAESETPERARLNTPKWKVMELNGVVIYGLTTQQAGRGGLERAEWWQLLEK